MAFVSLPRVAQICALALTCGCAEQTIDDDTAASEAAVSSRAPITISYGAHELDLYPPATSTAGARPLVVWIHGGAFAKNSRRDPHLVRLARHTASLGYVSVSIDYTLANAGLDEEHPFPYPAAAVAAARDDARAALRFLRAHAGELGIDPDAVAIGGASAGAITALTVAYGSTPEKRDPGIRAVVDLWGALPGSGLEPGDAPLLVLHGTADQRWMPFAQAERLRDSARAAGVPCTFIPLRGKNHGPWEDLDDYLERITPFLRRYLESAVRR